MSTRTPVYLDYNASAPLIDPARTAMMSAMDVDANPSSVHQSGRKLRAIIQKARRQVASLVNAKPDHVVFTSGATEAATMALTPHYSMGRAALKMSKLYVCAADHPCTLEGGRFDGADVETLPVNRDGILDMVALEEVLVRHDKTAGLPLVVCHYANNETGVIQPAEAISAIVKKHGGLFVLDAVQAIGRLEIDLSSGIADYVIVSSHKIGGPKGAGALIAYSDLVMPLPLIKGGGQERGHRSGTESPVTIAGFGAAAEAARANMEQFADCAQLRNSFEARMRAQFDGVTIHGAHSPRLPNTSFISFENAKAETLQIAMDLAGYAISSGSACSSGKVGKSHVLDAMGADAHGGALRVSIGPMTTPEQMDAFAQKLVESVQKIRGT